MLDAGVNEAVLLNQSINVYCSNIDRLVSSIQETDSHPVLSHSQWLRVFTR